MESISVTFNRLPDLTFEGLCYAVGVYVLWAGKSLARPTYIGEGDIMDRLGKHRRRFPRPMDGYVAILGDGEARTTKRHGEVVEAVLLAIAERVDRYPTRNKKGGKLRYLNRFFAAHATVKLVFDGYDPLLEPGVTCPMSTRRTVRITRVGKYFRLQHQWRLRRLRLPPY